MKKITRLFTCAFVFMAVFFVPVSYAYGIQIFVSVPPDKKITLKVEHADTIESVKQKIEDVENIPSNKQILVFGGKKLEDGRTLQDNRISQESTLFLLIRNESNINIVNPDSASINGKIGKLQYITIQFNMIGSVFGEATLEKDDGIFKIEDVNISGASGEVKISFDPKSEGVFNNSLTITDASGILSSTVDISGIGVLASDNNDSSNNQDKSNTNKSDDKNEPTKGVSPQTDDTINLVMLFSIMAVMIALLYLFVESRKE